MKTLKYCKKDNKLYYLDFEIELLPESKTKFFRSDDHERTIEFISNKKGEIVKLLISKAGVIETKNKNK
jgi:hypothetical protein